MLTKTEARALIEKQIIELGADVEWMILDDQTLEYDWGWAFFYQSREFVETGEPSAMLAGNAPYLVNRETEEVVLTGTAYPVEHYVRDYEDQLSAKVQDDD